MVAIIGGIGLGLLAVIVTLLWRIEMKISLGSVGSSDLMEKMASIEEKLERKGSVTDPFKVANKTHTVGASSKSVVIRKTPDQIRAENYQKIKEGASYGHDS